VLYAHCSLGLHVTHWDEKCTWKVHKLELLDHLTIPVGLADKNTGTAFVAQAADNTSL